MTDQVRTIAGRYVLGEMVGRGGVADVHRALDLVLDRPVAVKLLRETAQAAADRARFTSEVGLLAGLSHRGLVTVLDAGTTDDDQPYLVMELVEGPTLRQVMNHGPVAADSVADVGAQVASALAYAHAQHVVHRDVKPGNVLIDATGRARLADFGIARIVGDTVHHTRTGEAVGTVAYLSPEQVLGREVDGAADVYALGLVLLEALTARRAFPGATTDAAFARVARAPELPDTVPPGWQRLLRAMTSADPAARPGAGDVARALATAHSGDLAAGVGPAPAWDPPTVVAARAPQSVPGGVTPATRLRVPVRSRRLAGAAGAVIVLSVLIAGAVVSTPDPSESQARRRTTSSSTPSATPGSTPRATPTRRPSTPAVRPAGAVTPRPAASSVAPPAASPRTGSSATSPGKGHGGKQHPDKSKSKSKSKSKNKGGKGGKGGGKGGKAKG